MRFVPLTMFDRKVNDSGFTLIELFIVIAILSSLSFISFPYLQKVYIKSQIDNQIVHLTSALNTAKQTAINTQNKVTVCPVSVNKLTSTRRQESCGNDWNQPVMVFIDLDGNSALNEGEKLIVRLQKSLVNMEVNRTKFYFVSLFSASNTAGSFKLCPQVALDYLAQSVVVSNVGRIRVENDSNKVSCKN